MKSSLLTLILGFGCAQAGASDSDPLGFYVGGSVGRSNVRTTIRASAFDGSHTAWKALIGLRLIPLIAAELAYVDFGHPNSSTNSGQLLRMPMRCRGLRRCRV